MRKLMIFDTNSAARSWLQEQEGKITIESVAIQIATNNLGQRHESVAILYLDLPEEIQEPNSSL